jgi:hypothetical protein
MRFGFDMYIRPQNVCTIAIRDYSEDATGNRPKKTMITLFLTTGKLIVPGVLPKGHKYN